MIRIHFNERGGAARDITARGGMTLMEAAIASGIAGIEGECGGACSCATCHVVVATDWYKTVGGPSPMESDLLELAEARTGTSRLACQIKLSEAMDGLSVTVP